MAINTTTRQTTAFTSGNNFAFAFKVYEVGDVKVIRITTSTGAEEVLTITTHYTVTLNDDQNANPGGTVTLVNSGNPVNLGSGFNIVITSKVTPLQQTEITNQGGFFPEVINDVLDKAAILDQQQQAILNKTIRFPLTQTVGGLEITENAANRAGKVVQFDGSGDLAILGTVDGRDVSADGAKLDTIETNAKDDQTAAEIRALVESASDSNVFTDADHSKLNAIEAGATGDLNASEVKALYEGNSNTNVFSDAQVSKLNGIEAGATGDQSASEIRTLIGSANDSNVFTDNDHSKLDGIEAGATADQTSGDIKTLLQSDKLTASEIANGTITSTQIASGTLDSRYFTQAQSDARYFNISTGDTIKDGDTFPDNDTTIATTAAINDRIIDLVDDVGGFVPIANETSFPTANPDAENGTGTVVSVKAASTDLTPSGTTVTIANGAGTGNTVTITGVPSVIPSGYGFLVETTSTLHTYTFHRLVPKATEVTTVAGKATEIGRLGTVDAVADMAILGTTDVVADMNMLATTDIVADMALLATTDVIADMALLAVSDVISDMNDLATSANITAMANCSNSISSINNASSNLNSINKFGNTYQISANDPTTDGGGNALAEGDLYFNTSANELKVYNGSSWQAGVTATGNFATVTGNTFTGDNRYNDGVKLNLGTHSDLQIFHSGTNSFIQDNGTGSLLIGSGNTSGAGVRIRGKHGEESIVANSNGSVQLYYDANKKLETTSTGTLITGQSKVDVDTNLNSDTEYNGQDFGFLVSYDGGFDANSEGNGICFAQQYANSDSSTVRTGAIIGYKQNANGNFGGGLKLKTQKGGANPMGTALQLDQNQNVLIPNDNAKLQIGASQDLALYHTGSGSRIENLTGTFSISNAANEIQINKSNSEYMARFITDGAVKLYFDNSKKFETTSEGVTITDKLGIGTTATNVGLEISRNTQSGIRITDTAVTDASFDIRPQTGNSTKLFRIIDRTANADRLTITSDGDVQIPADGKALKIGTTQDLKLFHNGSHSIISNTTGDLKLRVNNTEGAVHCVANGAVQLYYDNSKKLETTSTGVTVTGTVAATSYTGDGSNLTGINTDLVSDSSPQLGGNLDVNGKNIVLANSGGANDDRIVFGSSANYVLFFDGSSGVVQVTDNSSKLRLGGSIVEIVDQANAEVMAKFVSDAQTELYYDNSKKFETTSTGVNLSGTTHTINGDFYPSNDNSERLGLSNRAWSQMNAYEVYVREFAQFNDNIKAKFGSNADLEIYHNGSNSFIDDAGTGDLFIRGDNALKIQNAAGSEQKIVAHSNNSVELYYDGSKKLETYSSGIYVTGHCQPNANNGYDLGSTSLRWRNIYTNDLNLSNEGSSNDVDGTWGSYTIQEGAEDLFLVNKRNGKKYKFNLTEVS